MLVAEKHRGVLEGLALADSITLDPHKWFYAPVDGGAILVRDGGVRAGPTRGGKAVMPAYVIVDIEVRDRVEYEKYKAAASATVTAFGGRYLVRGGRVETLEGSWTPRRFVVLEFPDFERAKGWWSSSEYAAAKAIRQACAATEMIVADGVPV